MAVLGRRTAMLILNGVIAVGIGITMVEALWSFLLGRFIFGFGAGTFSVISPMFISEICPPELTGPLGIINQFMVCFGILLSYIVGIIFVPYPGNLEKANSKIWRLVFGFPLIFIVIQVLLLLFVFRLDSPKYYRQKREEEKA